MRRSCRQITLFTKVRLLATETKDVDVKNTTKDDSPRPPIPEAIQTGLCLLLGIIGFIVKQLPIDSAFGWSLIPLLGAYAFGGFQTLVAAIASLTRRELNVDSLMIIAAIGAAILGDWVEGVILLFLFSLSGTLEDFASYRTSKSIESLVQLRPSTATRLLADSNEDQVVAIEQLNLGDKVRVKPGERFPVDGTVLEGESWADESTLTGESVPVPKQKGSPVFSGTLNSRGTVVVEMTKLIADSFDPDVENEAVPLNANDAGQDRQRDLEHLARTIVPRQGDGRRRRWGVVARYRHGDGGRCGVVNGSLLHRLAGRQHQIGARGGATEREQHGERQ